MIKAAEILFLRHSKSLSWTLLGIFLLLCIPSMILVSQLKSQYTLDQFQPTTHKLIDANTETEERFLLSKNYPFIISLSTNEEQGLWIDSSNMNALDQITQKIETHKDVEYSTSLANIKTAIIKDDSFILGPGKQLTDNKSTLKNSLLVPHILTEDGRHTSILVMPYLVDNKKLDQLLSHLEATTESSGYQTQIGGPTTVSTQMTRLLKKEVTLFALISFFIVVLTLSAMFRGWVAPVICLTISIIANLFGLAFMATLGLPLTVLTNTVPILITISVVAITSHTLIKLTLKSLNDKNRAQQILSLFKELYLPHLLTALTTSIGFGTLIFSDVFVISAYGKSVSASVFLSCIITLILLPALLILLPTPKPRKFYFSHEKWIDLILKYKKSTLLIIFLCFAAMSIKGSNLNWAASLFDELPNKHETRQASLFIDKTLGGTIPLDVSLISKKENAWSHSENIRKLDTLVETIRSENLSASAMGLSDFIKSARADKKLPTDDASLAQTLLLYGMSDENPLDEFITPNRSATRLSLRLRDIPSIEMENHINKIKTHAKNLFPDMEIVASGAAATIHPINEEISQELIHGFFKALFWIFLLLMIIFRSILWPVLSVIPNMIPPVFLLGGLAITQTPIKPHIAMIFTISLGIAFDNTVYILSRLKDSMKFSKQISIKQLLREESSPCFISSFSLFLGFSTFLFSYFKINQTFGAFMLLSITSGLIGDLVLLPLLLESFPKIKILLKKKID